MAQTTISFAMDETLKTKMEQTCKDMGMSMKTAFIIFANKVTKEKSLPFEVSIPKDDLYSEERMERFRQILADANSTESLEDRQLMQAVLDVWEGKSSLTEHELIEVDDDD